ncbi:tripartite tricarboxylate transporter TctB family protein [Paracoccus aerodenitrificans]|uniref:tripartite tricarboxylate transporter TctB family protein n=1 Tax=Paracoccus aerodenitrificans TaxID=3017781 RepID=UPI0022F1442E|nr:tripartite tricarboxylate transporter TctB family protein [Paracoccus aerodenitrificans]WBU64786.1 tripartite tricarboxylate transporter TctB family protein [Paracoccus aerodenitrificans]
MTAVRFVSAVMVGLGLVAAIIAWHLGVWSAGQPGPGLFPAIAGLLLAGTSIVCMATAGEVAEEEEPVDRRRLLQYGMAIVAFGLAMQILGAVIATFGLIFGVLRFIEHRSWLNAAVVAAVLAILSWAIFRHLLGVPLPTGLLEF